MSVGKFFDKIKNLGIFVDPRNPPFILHSLNANNKPNLSPVVETHIQILKWIMISKNIDFHSCLHNPSNVNSLFFKNLKFNPNKYFSLFPCLQVGNKAIIGLQPIIEYLEDYEVQPTIYPVVKTSKMGVYDTKKKFCLSIQRRLDKFLIMCMKNQEYKKSSIWKKILSKNHLSAEGSFLFPTTYPHLLDLKVLSTFYYLQKMRSLHPTSPTNGPQWFNFETQLNSLLDFMEARDTSFPVIEDDASRVLHQYQLEEDENVAENTNQDFEIGDLVSVYPIGFSGGYSTLKGLESEYFNNLNLSKVEDNCIFSGIFFGENNSSLIKLLVEFKIDDSENTYEAEITFSKTNLLLKKIIT